jgi:hypothetical protein
MTPTGGLVFCGPAFFVNDMVALLIHFPTFGDHKKYESCDLFLLGLLRLLSGAYSDDFAHW